MITEAKPATENFPTPYVSAAGFNMFNEPLGTQELDSLLESNCPIEVTAGLLCEIREVKEGKHTIAFRVNDPSNQLYVDGFCSQLSRETNSNLTDPVCLRTEWYEGERTEEVHVISIDSDTGQESIDLLKFTDYKEGFNIEYNYNPQTNMVRVLNRLIWADGWVNLYFLYRLISLNLVNMNSLPIVDIKELQIATPPRIEAPPTATAEPTATPVVEGFGMWVINSYGERLFIVGQKEIIENPDSPGSGTLVIKHPGITVDMSSMCADFGLIYQRPEINTVFNNCIEGSRAETLEGRLEKTVWTYETIKEIRMIDITSGREVEHTISETNFLGGYCNYCTTDIRPTPQPVATSTPNLVRGLTLGEQDPAQGSPIGAVAILFGLALGVYAWPKRSWANINQAPNKEL